VNLQYTVIENATIPQMTIAIQCLVIISLTTIHVSNSRLFSDINISQGSVATCLECDGIFSRHFTANLSLI